MGGTRKKSLSQMHKAQLVRERKAGSKRKEKGKERRRFGDVSTEGFFIDMDGARFVKEVSTMKVITPFEVASKFKVKLSIAKDILDELWRKGYIAPVSGNNRIRVFKFVGATKLS